MTHRFRRLLVCAAAAAAAGAAAQAEEVSRWNASPEPTALYGHCGSASSMGSKIATLGEVGESVEGVLAIKVLSCTHFTGGGGFVKQPCPAGSPYDFCHGAGNDGRGNTVKLGVLKAGPRTDPNTPYDGCPPGADARPKIDLVRPSGNDPRTLIGIVTLSCTAAAPARAVPAAAQEVPCPPGRLPFSECIGTPDDGHGNAVTLGLLRYRGTGDPDGLYGECDQGIQPGFASKRSVLAQVGRSTANVRAIDLLSCAVPWGYGSGFPAGLHTGSCVGLVWMDPALAPRYDYCVWGTDARNNGVVMGVSAP